MSLVLNDYELNYRMAEGDAVQDNGSPVDPSSIIADATTENSCTLAGGAWDSRGFCWKSTTDLGVVSSTKTTLGATFDKLFTTRNFLIAGVAFLFYKVFIKKHK